LELTAPQLLVFQRCKLPLVLTTCLFSSMRHSEYAVSRLWSLQNPSCWFFRSVSCLWCLQSAFPAVCLRHSEFSVSRLWSLQSLSCWFFRSVSCLWCLQPAFSAICGIPSTL